MGPGFRRDDYLILRHSPYARGSETETLVPVPGSDWMSSRPR